jgi:repressor LexA
VSKKAQRSLPPLTARQRGVLNFIAAYTAGAGCAPSLEEIRDHLGVSSVSTVHEHVANLIDKGYLERRWNQARSIVTARTAGRAATPRLVPVLGTVSRDGRVQLKRVSGEVGVPGDLARARGTYALSVREDGLREEGIQRGDTLVVEPRDAAGPGKLVVVSAGTRLTLARTGRRGIVTPLADAGARLSTRGSGLVVSGVVVGLVRDYR